MSDTQAPLPSPSLITATQIAYALFGAGAVVALVSHGFPVALPLFGILGTIAIIMLYVKRGEADGTWLASHYSWLIRTFWFSVMWGVIGGIIAALFWWLFFLGVVVAYVIWFITTIWVLYRLIRGYLLFNESKPIPDGVAPASFGLGKRL